MNYKQSAGVFMYEKSKAINFFFFLNKSMYVCISWAFNVERPLTALLLYFSFLSLFFPFFFFFIYSFIFLPRLPPSTKWWSKSWSSNCLLWILKRGRGLNRNKTFPSPNHTSYIYIMGRGFMLSCYD